MSSRLPSCKTIDLSWLNMNTFMLLKMTLAEDGNYGLGVYSLQIKTKHELTQNDLLDFFQQIPNLRILLAYGSSHNIILMLLSPETLLFRGSLQRLFLGCEIKPTASELFDITRPPKLQQLEVQGFIDFEYQDLSPSKGPDSMLTHLKFVGGQLRRQTLSSLIVTSPSIATLVCRTPLNKPLRKGLYPNSTSIDVPPSPVSMLSSLDPISQTLIKLDLSPYGQKWSGHDGTRLDLTSLMKLRYLGASAKLVVAPHVVSHDGLFKLLPPSLRTFKLDFGFSIGLLFSTHEHVMDEAGYQRFVDHTLDPSSYEWIIELARHKHECSRHLKHIRLYDRTRELLTLSFLSL